MNFELSDEQRLLADGAQAFFAERAPVAAYRQLRDGSDGTGFSPALWHQMASLGWAGMLISSADEGMGVGLTGFALVMEQAGRTLAASPLLGTSLIGGRLIARLGSEKQRTTLLPRIAAGTLVVAPAVDDDSRHDLRQIRTSARHFANGWSLNGAKTLVLDGMAAELLLVLARTGAAPGETAGLSLFLVEPQMPGVEREPLLALDHRGLATVRFTDVRVPPSAMLGGVGDVAMVLEAVLDEARIALAAEMLGHAQEVFDRTLAYLLQRRQFGVPIGSFQALQHRMARLYAEIELARSVVLAAAASADANAPNTAALASHAKARLGEVTRLTMNEGIQLHGGIGMTDEHDVGLFLKRARVSAQLFGDSRHHRDRYARLNGF